ncbi:hypothetical protein ACP4OV_013168 [Aristida adscensionis]
MELAAAALGSLLPKLGTLLTDEYKLQKGVRGEIRFLKEEMEQMQAVLSELSKRPAHRISDPDKLWARDLKELSYDIEDSVDTFMVRLDASAKQQGLKGFRKFVAKIGLVRTAKTRHQVGREIDDIKIRIREVAERRARYMVQDVAPEPDATAIDPRLTALYEEVEMLVGVEGPAEKLTNMLMQQREGIQNQKLMVASIVGVGGLGKTTLGNQVYQRLKGQFMCHAFVSVSLKPNMNKIFSSILRQVSGKDYINAEEWEHTELVTKIRQVLEEKRYIIVIDDVWDKSAWTSIKYALTNNNLGSKVIVTTRKADVAKISCLGINDTIYELDPLSDTDSKRLLYKRIFNPEEEIPSELEEVMDKILRKCGGIPLAIITIASMLANTPNKTQYEWYGVYGSMGSGLDKDKSLENMRAILYLSYGDLPFYLKPCLLCLSIFPEDHKIGRKDLIRLWIAEGLVVEKQGSNLYDLGERYFNELINRSMIQLVDVDVHDGSTAACRVHDMILDLIISLSEQENFVTISEGQKVISPVSKIRRLSLQGCREVDIDAEDSKVEKVILPTTVNTSHVRSLIAFGDAFRWTSLSRFSVLRVLALEYFSCKNNHPKVIGSLHHLRYIKLGGMLETELLEQIGNLKLLTTLNLEEARIKELPANIFQLKQLECLIVSYGGMKFPDGIGNLTSLQELWWLNMETSPNTLAELSKLTKLQVLKILGLDLNESYMKTFLWSLSNLGNIRTLTLHSSFAAESHSLDCMSDTCTLPALRSLLLYPLEDSAEEQRLVISSDQSFRSLAEFRFEGWHGEKLRSQLVFSQGAMPKLQRLTLDFLVQRRVGGGIHSGLENLSSLRHITVTLYCEGARIREVEDVENKIRNAIAMHPNHPTLDMQRNGEYSMVRDEIKDGPGPSEISSDLLATKDKSEDDGKVSEQCQA